MNMQQAAWGAEDISQRYGTSVLFREPSRRESYQAIVSEECLPPGARIVGRFVSGAEVSSQLPSQQGNCK